VQTQKEGAAKATTPPLTVNINASIAIKFLIKATHCRSEIELKFDILYLRINLYNACKKYILNKKLKIDEKTGLLTDFLKALVKIVTVN